MTKSKALKLLKQQLEKGDIVVINLYDIYKKDLKYDQKIVETKGKSHFSLDLRDFITEQVKISDIIKNLEKEDAKLQDVAIDIKKIAEEKCYMPELRVSLTYQVLVKEIEKMKEPMMIPAYVVESVNELDDFRRVPENKKILDDYKYTLKRMLGNYLRIATDAFTRENPMFM